MDNLVRYEMRYTFTKAQGDTKRGRGEKESVLFSSVLEFLLSHNSSIYAKIRNVETKKLPPKNE